MNQLEETLMRQPTILKYKLSEVISRVILAAVLSGVATTVSAADLTVNIKHIDKAKGHILVALYSGKSSYDSGKTESFVKIKVSRDTHTAVFKDIVDGDYAVKLYHDENDNNKLDKNIFGIPKEDYGFSNNGASFGAPDYEEAKFGLKDTKTIEITLT